MVKGKCLVNKVLKKFSFIFKKRMITSELGAQLKSLKNESKRNSQKVKGMKQ